MCDERDPQTYSVIGAGMQVHGRMGCGFQESAYQSAFAVECRFQRIPFEREVKYEIQYRNETLDCCYRADFVCFGQVIVKLKVVEMLTDKHRSQIINYLKVSGLKRGVLMNFANERLEYERIVLDYSGS
ncbi:MAG: GxxExxY protein [Candidatus Hydrogenedentes bacterium]|nr:GxxExxY protein [Candidatus Hydrogenedentota bacterium]